MKRFPLILNKQSGTVLSLGEENVRNLVQECMGDCVSDIQFLDVCDLPEAIDRLGQENPSGILIGGGDGSAVCAAETLAAHQIPFGILPLGTMNLLAQDLGSAPSFEETVRRFKGLRPSRIDSGLVNGKRFLCSAVVGFVPEGAIVREELRENPSLQAMARFISTIARGIGGTIKHNLYLKSRMEDNPFSLTTTALIISNNGFIQNPDQPMQRFSRESLTDGKLAVYSASPCDVMDGLKMALSMWQGDWQDHESIMSFDAVELIVESSDKDMLVSLDGEPVEMKSPLCFKVEPRSVPVLRLELVA